MNDVDSKNKNKTKELCYCSSKNCVINKGLYVLENYNNDQIFHKNKCCLPCKIKYQKVKELESKILETKDMRNIAESRSKETKVNKLNSNDSKKNMEEISKKNSGTKEGWNSSTKVDTSEKKTPAEVTLRKKLSKKVKIPLKTSKEKETDISEVSDKVKKDKKSKSVKTKGSNENEIEEEVIRSDSAYDDEPIYVSYSLRGYLKIRSRNNPEICDKYYSGCHQMCQNCVCKCSDEEIGSTCVEKCCNCCENYNGYENDCFFQESRGESCGCNSRCIFVD